MDSDYIKNKSAKYTRKHKYRKYDGSYRDNGVMAIEINGDETPQRLIPMKVLAPKRFLASKLKRHLNVYIPQTFANLVEFWQQNETINSSKI